MLGREIKGRAVSEGYSDRRAQPGLHWSATERGSRIFDGSVPEWPMGSGCKPDGLAYGGSNPSWPTKVNPRGLATSDVESEQYGVTCVARGVSWFE